MSSQKTNNLSLHQWGSSDAVSRAEFNENFALLDADSAAVRGLIAAQGAAEDHLVYGSYTGNDAASREIVLGFAPKAVLLLGAGNNETNELLVWPGMGYQSGMGAMLELTGSGFRVAYGTYNTGANTYAYRPITNMATWNYRYLAVK